ncbi:CYTH-like domain-containing protein [Aspergillus bertholletiae]|uniref:Thiamine-triphosphatase n=1 Tax=Aspergillus bertholletiae TaxID=1226010 RepID=A0A5N7BIJ2_9EURO|nr:CYTH-like domain-containing protein [Aspergillus bertholletiae]
MLVLEVERKFCRLAVPRLRIDGGVPPFRSLTYRGKQSFHDIYFDNTGFLCSKGVWIRQRDGHWQAKIRRGGDYINSKFEELSAPDRIADYLEELMGVRNSATANFGLTQMAAFTTTRESWKADQDFTVVQDVTDFGHTVGEVELECQLGHEGNSDSDSRTSQLAEMDARIATFMKRYSWAFAGGIPKGKLTAYFEKFRGA